MKYLPLLCIAFVAGCSVAGPTTPNAPVQTQALSQVEQPGILEADRTYKLEDVLGIGPVYATKLRTSGVTTIAKLLDNTQGRTDRQKLARETGIPYGNVLHLARKVELMKIKGVGVRQSNLLEAVGVDSVKELAYRNPENLRERLRFANNIGRKFVGYDPSQSMVTRWVDQAREMVSSGKAIME